MSRLIHLFSVTTSISLVAFTFAGCSSGSSNTGCSTCGSQNTILSVTVTVASASVQTKATDQFTATVNWSEGNGSQAVTWSVNGGNANGSINSSGLYTAPSSVPSVSAVTVTALAADGKTSGSATITIMAGQPQRQVVYTDDADQKYTERIWAFPIDNPGAKVQISANDSNSQDLYGAVSPDGTIVAYIKQGTTESLYTAPITGGVTPTLVINWPDSHYSPMGLDWNPSGSGFVVAYTDSTTGICGLETISLDGKTIQPLSATNISCTGGFISNPPELPRYLSDGRIVYQAQAKILMLSADKTTVTSLGNGYAVSPSPDGTHLAISYQGTITITDINGNNGTVLTSGDHPGWCGDGNIVFQNGQGIASIPNGGGAINQLVNNGGYAFYPNCR